MRKFNSSSSPTEFQAEYQRLLDIILSLGNEAEAESKLPKATLAESCTRLGHLIEIRASILQALHKWKETLITEKDLLCPSAKRATEIEEDIAQLDEKISHVETKKQEDESLLTIALIRLKLESSQSHHDDSQDAHEDKPGSALGCG